MHQDKPMPAPRDATRRAMSHLIVRTTEEADCLMSNVRSAATRVLQWVAAQTGNPLDMLRRMKFEPVGFHPIEDRPLNLVEQINQTWTYAVAIAAARQILILHPNVGGLRLAPGAHAALELDIMSEQPGAVGAEAVSMRTWSALVPLKYLLYQMLAERQERPFALT